MAKPYFGNYLLKGRNPIMNLDNVCIALENDEYFKGRLCYNELSNKIMMKTDTGEQDILDWEITQIQRYLQRECNLNSIGETITASAVMHVAYKNKFHPIRNFLYDTKWDGVPRLEEWLTWTLGVEPTKYTRDAARIFFLQAVARVMEPGCQADYILVLHSDKQGIGKSTVCRLIFEPWFTDVLPDITSKDGMMALSGVWGIEIAEMHAFLKEEAAATKSFTTRRVERYRLPYGRSIQEFGRQCVLIGTTNVLEFIADTTGGRRFWGVTCGVADAPHISWLVDHRNQLWAEAMHLYRAGAARHPSPEDEARYFKPEQDARQEYDELATNLLTYCRSIDGMFTISQAWTFAGLGIGTPSAPQARRIAAILRQNGYQHVMIKGIRYWKSS